MAESKFLFFLGEIIWRQKLENCSASLKSLLNAVLVGSGSGWWGSEKELELVSPVEATTVYLLPIYLAGNYLPIYWAIYMPINVNIYMIIHNKKSTHLILFGHLKSSSDSIHRRLQHRSKDLKISNGIFFLASAPHIISYALVEPDPRRPNCLDADMSLLFIRLSSLS